MRLKSYHSATVEAAIRLAHIELGDEAVFLGSRRNDVGADPNQAYEVTFAVMSAEDAGPNAAEPPNQQGVSDERGAAAHPRQKVASAAAAAGDAEATASDDERNGIVSWKKLLRHVSQRPPAESRPDNGQRETPLHAATAQARTAQLRKELARTAQATKGQGAEQDGPAGRNGQAKRGGLALPHWREFVPGDERVESPQDVLLTDASRVLQAGASQAGSGTAPAPAPSRRGGTHVVANGRVADSGVANGVGANPATAHATGAQGAAARPAKKNARGMSPPAEDRTTEVYSLQKLGAELEELRRMFERQQAGRSPLVLPSRELLSDNRLAGIYHRLSDNAIEPSLAAELVAGLQRAAAEGAEGRRLGAMLAEEVRRRFATNGELGQPGAPRMAAALVGPSGAGKTTAVAKLAFRCGLLRRRRVQLFSVDPLRVGAVESLQAYAELMNLPFEIVDDFDKLGAALDAGGGDGAPELLLIDTPGYGRREWERARRLAKTFLERGDIDVHLVLDLRTKTEDLHRAVENFSVFRPAKLLFTRLDETATFGTMLNETVRTGLPVSFVSVGQRVPEDIVPAGEPELLRLLLKDRSSN